MNREFKARRVQRSHLFECITIILLGVIALELGASDLSLGIGVLACLSIALGVRGFLVSGGPNITPSGVFMLSSSVFVGIGAVLGVHVEKWGVSTESYFGASESLLRATFILLVVQMATYYGYWTKPFTEVQVATVPEAFRYRRKDRLVLVGLGLSGVGVLATRFSFLGPIPEALCFAGVVSASSAVFTRRRIRSDPLGIGVILTATALYYFNTFDGFGRLRVAALFLALLTILSYRARARMFKVSLVAIVPPALGVMTMQRGASSVIDPVYVFAGLVDLASRGELAYGKGETFLASAVLLFPRAFWPEKPVGFGRELAMIFHPQYVQNGHSDVALFAGEWFYNFGWVGLILMIPLVGKSIRLLDQWALRHSSIEGPGHTTNLLLLATAATLTAGMMDLFWVGTSTFMARTGSRLAVLLIVYWGTRLLSRPSSRSLDRVKRARGGPDRVAVRVESDGQGQSRSGYHQQTASTRLRPNTRASESAPSTPGLRQVPR